MAEEETMSLPPSANSRNLLQFSFNKFLTETYSPFVTRFIEEVKDAFKQLDFWLSFTVLDPRKLPEDVNGEEEYGEAEIEKLASW